MAIIPNSVTKTIDNVDKLINRLDVLTQSDVLVGIPAEKATRKGQPINNAALAYIHEFGSPLHHIPARPFLIPGVAKIRRQAMVMLRQGALDVLKGGSPLPILNRVGMLARNSVVESITDPVPPFVPLKPATIRARLRRTAAGRRQLRKLKGDALTSWAEAGNIKPLIDTGQLRAAITYVVRPIWRKSTRMPSPAMQTQINRATLLAMQKYPGS
jgi:hypothetical protein